MAGPAETHDAAVGGRSAQRGSLFRREALDHHLSAERDAEGQVLRVSPPWSWGLFGLLCGVVLASLVIACVAHVDITSKARGVLRAPGGVRSLQPQVGGMVTEVHAHSGQAVQAGQVLITLESASIQAALLEADRKLALARDKLAAFASRQEALYARRLALLRRRVGLLAERERSLDRSVERYDNRAQSYDDLDRKGAVGWMTRDDAVEHLAQAERQRLSSREEVSQTRLAIAALEAERQSDRFRWEEEVQAAETRRNALAFSLEQTTLKAPQSGVLEALLVRPGDVVQPGAPIGRLVAGGAPTHIVAFLQERDRAFVTPGAEVRVEVEQLPYAEFGTLRARVARVAADLAPPYEVKEALGEESSLAAPVYRVELALEQDGRARSLAARLRPGMLVQTRFTLRTRRLIGMVLDPLRRFVE